MSDSPLSLGNIGYVHPANHAISVTTGLQTALDGKVAESELTDTAAVKALDQGVATTDSPTFANLTSTGIDDNATSTAITIDASENVGVGNATPATALDVTGTVTATSFAGSGASLSGVNTGNLLNMAVVVSGSTQRSDSNSWVDSTAVTYTTVNSSSTILILVDIEATLHMWGGVDDDAMYAVQLLRVSPSAATLAGARQVMETPNDRVGGGGDLAGWTTGPHWGNCKFTLAAKFGNTATAGNDITFKLQQADAAPSVFDLNKVTYSIWEYAA